MKLRDYIEELSFAVDFILMDSIIDIIAIGEIQYRFAFNPNPFNLVLYQHRMSLCLCSRPGFSSDL